MGYAFLNGAPERPQWETVGRAWRCDPPEEPEQHGCGECSHLRIPGGCEYGVCSLRVAEFCDDYVENMPKWTSVDRTIDWVLEHLLHCGDEACERFEEYEG